jgi:phosphomevalonate kinase
VIVSAPGKLVLLGEYAVTEDGLALVAAVGRRAVGRAEMPPPRPSPVVQAVVDEALARGVLRQPPNLSIDTSRFTDGAGHKLGLGSSAAVAAVSAGWMTTEIGDGVLELAVAAHRAAAGGVGSGIDVAASVLGGVIAARRQPGPWTRVGLGPQSLHLVVLFTGESASTPGMVAACKASSAWPRHVEALAALSEEGVAAWRAGDAEAFLPIVDAFGRRMAQLGDDAGVPVVTARIAEVMRQARALGGAAKPSGAGGGDVALAFLPDPGAAAELARRADVVPVDLSIDPRGLALDPG